MTKFIVGLILVVAAFLGGYVPQRMSLNTAKSQVATLQQQLAEQTQARTLADFRNETAVLYTEVAKNNYSTAGDHATKLFTGLQAFADQAPAPLKQKLEQALQSRDAITAAIAKADPGSAALIQSMFLELQGA